MSENHREPEVPEEEVPVVERLDGPARITSKELAITHFVKDGTLQCACSTRPRVVVGLVKSALMRTVRLMNILVKGTKNDDKSAVAMLKKNDWHENVREPVVNHAKDHDRSGRPDVAPSTMKTKDELPDRTSSLSAINVSFTWKCCSSQISLKEPVESTTLLSTAT